MSTETENHCFRVLVLGGSGVFGQNICRHLCEDMGTEVIAAGRSQAKLDAFAAEVDVKTAAFDIAIDLEKALKELQPDLVIHAAGPFQGADYAVAEACIGQAISYIDLSDGRDFVMGFSALDEAARKAGVVAITGASSVPGLSSAAYSQLAADFAAIDSLEIGIAPGNRAPRGLAVMQAILGYTGKPIPRYDNGLWGVVSGWQDLHRRTIPGLGTRWFSACDVPDVALFPLKAPNLKRVAFYAGLELPLMHLGLWLCSWPVRWGLIKSLVPAAKLFQILAGWLYPLGSDRGGMYVLLEGVGLDGAPLRRTWSLVAESGDGPHIPSMAAVILARKLASGAFKEHKGAMVCFDLFTVDEFLDSVKVLDIKATCASA